MKLTNDVSFGGLFSHSAWGVGLAIMFPLFQDRLGLPLIWLNRIDSALALSVVIFAICVSYYSASIYEKNKEIELSGCKNDSKLSKLIGVFFILCGAVGGIYYIHLASRSPSVNGAATVLGYVLLGASLIFFVKTFDRICKAVD